MKRTFVCIATSIVLNACGIEQNSTSNLSVRYGEEIEELDYPEVAFMGNCTGTFVSATTLITAKHCVGRPDRTGRVRSMISLPRQEEVRSLQVFANPNGNNCCTRHDVAVAIFPEGTALAVADLDLEAAVVNADVTMVGYGGRSGDPTAGDFGIKRMGSNNIYSLRDGMIETRMPAGAGLAPGDSGGPLFSGNKLIGVASSGDGRTWSRHVALANSEALKVLRIAVENGADIPGIE